MHITEQLEEMSKAPIHSADDDTGGVRFADLLDTIEGLIIKYINLPARELAMLLAVWIAGTYVY